MARRDDHWDDDEARRPRGFFAGALAGFVVSAAALAVLSLAEDRPVRDASPVAQSAAREAVPTAPPSGGGEPSRPQAPQPASSSADAGSSVAPIDDKGAAAPARTAAEPTLPPPVASESEAAGADPSSGRIAAVSAPPSPDRAVAPAHSDVENSQAPPPEPAPPEPAPPEPAPPGVAAAGPDPGDPGPAADPAPDAAGSPAWIASPPATAALEAGAVGSGGTTDGSAGGPRPANGPSAWRLDAPPGGGAPAVTVVVLGVEDVAGRERVLPALRGASVAAEPGGPVAALAEGLGVTVVPEGALDEALAGAEVLRDDAAVFAALRAAEEAAATGTAPAAASVAASVAAPVVAVEASPRSLAAVARWLALARRASAAAP